MSALPGQMNSDAMAIRPVRQTGFTLIELIMVIVIMGALSAVVLTSMDKDIFEAEAAAGELIQAIRYAQEKSMTNTGAAKFQIVVSATDFRVTQAGADIPHPADGAASFQASWSGVSISPTGTIIFDGYGEPSLSGGLSFSSNQQVINLTVGTDTRSITLERVTGFTR